MKHPAARQGVFDTVDYRLASESLLQTVGGKKTWLIEHPGNFFGAPAQMSELLDQALHHQTFIPCNNSSLYFHRIIGIQRL